MESNMFSSQHIQNEVFTITSEHPYYENYLKRKFQAKVSPYDNFFEIHEE